MKYKQIMLLGIMAFAFACSVKSSKSDGMDLDKIKGKWKVTKTIHSEPYEVLSEKDADACWGEEIMITSNSISSNSKCFKSRSCPNTAFKMSKESVLQYFEHDSLLMSELGLTDDSLVIVKTSCEVPYSAIYMLDENRIMFGMDNYHYYLEKSE